MDRQEEWSDEDPYCGTDDSMSDDGYGDDGFDWTDQSSLPPKVKSRTKVGAAGKQSSRKSDQAKPAKTTSETAMTDLLKSPTKAAAAGLGVVIGLVVSRLVFGWLFGAGQNGAQQAGQPDPGQQNVGQ